MYAATILDIIRNKELMNETSLSLIKNLIDDSPYSSLLQILYVENLHYLGQNDELKEAMFSASTVSLRERLFNIAIPKFKEARKQRKSDVLINEFLKKNPTIKRPNVATDENTDLSLDSIKEDEEVASETLAEIYCKQGNYEKAIGIYKKLCLANPEKSIYFAAQIQKIEEQLKK